MTFNAFVFVLWLQNLKTKLTKQNNEHTHTSTYVHVVLAACKIVDSNKMFTKKKPHLVKTEFYKF